MDPILGQIIMFAGNFAPKGWAFCYGQLMSIGQNTALFAILGNTYGGDGRTTFALPDLRGRVPIGTGTGPGLSSRRLGYRGGMETTNLSVANLPPHTHSAMISDTTVNIQVTVNAYGENGGEDSPHQNYWAGAQKEYDATADTTMNPGAVPANGALNSRDVQVGQTGGGQSFNNMQPYLGMNYIISLQGTFPSRN